MLTKFHLYIPTTQHTGTIVVPSSDQWYKDCGFDSPWRCGIFIQNMTSFVVKTSHLQNLTLKVPIASCWFLAGVDLWTSVISDRRDYNLSILYNTVKLQNWTWVTYISNVLSNKKILFDILDFWCQLVVIRFVKTLSKRRMFVSFMKTSACWLPHRLIKFNKICWEKRPSKPRPNLRTSFCRRDLKNTQPHLKWTAALFPVKFARFRNFFDFAQIWGILPSIDPFKSIFSFRKKSHSIFCDL